MKTCGIVVLLIGMLQAAQAVDWYVATNGTGQGTNGWADATNSLQGAIDRIPAGAGNTVWVSNGVYAAGGVTNYPPGYSALLTNRVAITKQITVRSKDNNPANAIIKGSWHSATVTNGTAAVRCVYMAANSTLIGFTITNGAVFASGGGVFDTICGGILSLNDTSPVISNCIITGNSGVSTTYGGGGAYYCSLRNCMFSGNVAYSGAGAYNASLYNCILTGNSAYLGGGASGSTLYNCLVAGNKADGGGGVYQGSMYNCTVIGNRAAQDFGGGVHSVNTYNSIVYFNISSGGNSNWYTATLTYSCTAPAASGAGNITGNPMLVDKGSGYGTNHVAGNYRLTSRSPCINAGTNFAWMTDGSVTSRDLDGRQRLRYGTVDMGAYEYIRAGTVYGIR